MSNSVVVHAQMFQILSIGMSNVSTEKEIRAVLMAGIYGRENSKQVVIVLFSI